MRKLLHANVSGDGEHVASLLQCVLRRNECAALFGRFDNENAERQAADQPIAHGEVATFRRRIRRKLTEKAAVLLDLAEQKAVLARINYIHTAAKHAKHGHSRIQRAAQCHCVDAARTTRDNYAAARCDQLGKLLRVQQAVSAAPP